MPSLLEIKDLSMPMSGGGGGSVDDYNGAACGGGGGGLVDDEARDTCEGEGGWGGGRGRSMDGVATGISGLGG